MGGVLGRWLTLLLVATAFVCAIIAVTGVIDLVRLRGSRVTTATVVAVSQSGFRSVSYKTELVFVADGRKVNGTLYLKQNSIVATGMVVRYARSDPTVFEPVGSNDHWKQVAMGSLVTIMAVGFLWIGREGGRWPAKQDKRVPRTRFPHPRSKLARQMRAKRKARGEE